MDVTKYFDSPLKIAGGAAVLGLAVFALLVASGKVKNPLKKHEEKAKV